MMNYIISVTFCKSQYLVAIISLYLKVQYMLKARLLLIKKDINPYCDVFLTIS